MTKIEQVTIPEGYKQTEIGVIPEDWRIHEFGELVNYIKGYPFKSAEYTNDGIRVIRVSDTTRDSIEDKNAVFVTSNASTKYKKWKLKECDLIFTTVGSKPPMYDSLVGKAIFVTAAYDGSLLNQNAVLIRSKNGASYFQRLLLGHFRTERYIDHIELIFRGNANQASITLGNLFEFKLPIPSDIKEQTAIANALSDVDNLIAALETLIAKKSAIKTAAMQQLLTGKTRLPGFGNQGDSHLTDSRSMADTTHIKDIDQTATRLGYKQTELGEIPEDWEVVSYDESFKFLTTASNSRSDLTEVDELSYIHYGDIHTLWDIKLDFSKVCLPKISQAKVGGAVPLKDGDVIMADASEDYAGIGKSIEIQGLGSTKAVAGLHTFLLRDKGYFVDGFRSYLHLITSVKSNFDRLATGLKVYGLSKNSLKEVLLSVPPKQEQTAIANVLSDMDTELDALQQRLSKTQQIKQGMMQELLTGKTRLV